MAVEVSGGARLEVGTPVLLFPTKVNTIAAYPFYDVSPDGKRFLINEIAEEPGQKPITLVSNWTAGLRK